MAYLDFVNIGVNPASSGQYRYATNTRSLVLVKNIGTVTVYIGSTETSNGSATVSSSQGYPLAPGESVKVPGLLTSDGYQLSFNTASGQLGGVIRVLALTND